MNTITVLVCPFCGSTDFEEYHSCCVSNVYFDADEKRVKVENIEPCGESVTTLRCIKCGNDVPYIYITIVDKEVINKFVELVKKENEVEKEEQEREIRKEKLKLILKALNEGKAYIEGLKEWEVKEWLELVKENNIYLDDSEILDLTSSMYNKLVKNIV